MGCYPSRVDGSTTIAGGDQVSPATSPVAGCCAPVRNNGVPREADNGKYTPPHQSKPPDNAWTTEQINKSSDAITPGKPTSPEAPSSPPKASQDPAAQLLPGAMGAVPGAPGESPNQHPAPVTDGQGVSSRNDDATLEEQLNGPPRNEAPEAPAPPAIDTASPAPDVATGAAGSPKSPSKYKAFVPVGDAYVPVKTAESNIDFEAEKAKIEAEFCKLEQALDQGTMERSEIERQFEMLTNEAARLRRLQAASQAPKTQAEVDKAPMKPPVKLAPVAAPAATEGQNLTPTMAVVHWKGVTKKKFVVYKDLILEKYGNGPDGIKSIERIPNRILITVPVAEVMMKMLNDTDLDPRPEPYKLPGGNSAPPKPANTLSKPGALQSHAMLAPPDGLAPLRSPAGLPTRAASPFAAR